MTAVDRLGRAWDLYRRTASTRSAILLLLANLIPLAGVLFFDWSLLTILVLYWLENGIVGVWNVPKIILAQGSLVTPARAPGAPTEGGLLGPQARARLAVIPRTALAIFFSFHYGMFWLVHGIFVFSLPAFAGAGGGPLDAGPCFDPTGFPEECAGGAFGALAWPSVLIGGVALFVSHGASFFLNYLGRGEHRTASPSGQMGSVYGRVVVLHLTIILGSMVVAFLGSPVGALIVLVVLKTLFDLNLHLRERRRAGTPATPGPGNATQAAPRSDNLQPEQP